MALLKWLSALPRERVARISASCFFFIAGIAFASWASRIPEIKLKLHLSDAGFGGVLFALPVGLMTSLPLSGFLVTRFGSKRMILTAALLYPFVLILLGLVTAVWQLATVLFFFGLLGNLFNISVNTQAVAIESLYKRSIMASFHGLWSLAGFSGAAIGTLMVSLNLLPYQHFIIIFSMCVALLLIAQSGLIKQDLSNGSQPLFAIPDLFVLKLGLIAFGSMVCEGAMFDWSGVYFQKIVMAPKALITLGYVVFMGMMASGRFISDGLVTKYGTKHILQLSGLFITAGLVTAIIFPNIIAATFGFLLVGFGVSSVVPLVYGLAGKSKTMAPGVALAAVSTIGFLGFLGGPPMIGFIAESFNLRWSFSVIACLGFGTYVMATLVKIDQ